MGRGLSPQQNKIMAIANQKGKISTARVIAATLNLILGRKDNDDMFYSSHEGSIYFIAQASASRSLRRLEQRGLLEHVAPGHWRVTTEEERNAPEPTAEEKAKCAARFAELEARILEARQSTGLTVIGGV